MKRFSNTKRAFALTTALTAAAVLAPGQLQAQNAGAGKAKAAPSPAEELAQKAVAAAAKENFEEALELFREAYRTDRNPRWLYNMGVLHDRLAECDDAAFFYRAALWGKPSGVLPQDRDAVDNRLGVLEDECHFKKRHATPADRHTRAGRYIGLRLCTLAGSILEGIATPQEKQQLAQCSEKKQP